MRSWLVAFALVLASRGAARAQVASVSAAPILGGAVDRDELEALPIPGTTLDVVLATLAVAPGNHADLTGTSFAGGTSPENRYYIDGFDTTGVVNGLLATRPLTEFVARVGVATGGLDASVNSSTGALVDVSTRRGGDTLHGAAFVYDTPGWLVARADAVPASGPAPTLAVARSFDNTATAGAEVGGRITPHLYFFAGVAATLAETDLVRSVTRSDGAVVARDTHEETTHAVQAIGSVDYRRGPRAVGLEAIVLPTATSDPTVPGIAPAATATSSLTSDVIAHGETLEHGRFLFDVTVGWHHGADETLPTNASLERVAQTFDGNADLSKIAAESAAVRAACANDTCPTAYRTGGPGSFGRDSEDRVGATVSARAFLQHHVVAAGIEAYDERWSSAQVLSGGKLGDVVEVRQTATEPMVVGDNLDDPNAQLHDHGVRGAAFAQDTWVPNGYVQIRAGARYSHQRIDATQELAGLVDPRTGRAYGDLTVAGVAPSLGVIVDPAGGPRTYLFYASWGRSLETVPLAITHELGDEVRTLGFVQPGAPIFVPSEPAERVAAGVRDQAVDDYVLGFSGQPRPQLIVTGAFHARRLVRALEDEDDPDDRAELVVANPAASRDYDALELTATRRIADRMLARASYTYARTIGNYEGLLDSASGQLQPNATLAFDEPVFVANRLGALPQDIPHTLRVDAAYFVAVAGGTATLGAGLRAQSGAPRGALGSDAIDGTAAILLLPQGALGRQPATADLDAHLGYRHGLPHHLALDVFVDVYNVLDTQTAILDAQYQTGLAGSQAISGGSYADLIWLRSVVNRNAGRFETADPVQRNAHFGQPLARTAPTYAQLGARLTF